VSAHHLWSQRSRLLATFRFYDLTESYDLTGGLEVRHGMFKGSRLAQGGALLNVGSTTSAFYQACCLRLLFDVWGKAHNSEFDYYDAFEAFIKGLRVKTNHLIDHGRKRTVLQSQRRGFTPSLAWVELTRTQTQKCELRINGQRVRIRSGQEKVSQGTSGQCSEGEIS
jgi:Argonaute linker 1 domain